MQTVHDWLTVGLFAILTMTFLERSMRALPSGDRAIAYLPPALGCALANYVGNRHYHLSAFIMEMTTAAYIWIVLRPGRGRQQP